MTSLEQGRKHLTFQMLFAIELFHSSGVSQRPARKQHVSAVNSSVNNSHVLSLVFYIADLKVLVKKGFNFAAYIETILVKSYIG